jgi:hypothetical protein
VIPRISTQESPNLELWLERYEGKMFEGRNMNLERFYRAYLEI